MVNATFVSGSIICVSPRLSDWRADATASVALEVSLNSQQFTKMQSYSYYETPLLDAVSPNLVRWKA